MIGIYAIENTITKKCYVGQSKNIASRFKQHLTMLSKNEHHSRKLQKDYNASGPQDFTLKILELCKEDELDKKEQNWIDQLNSLEDGYNIKPIPIVGECYLAETEGKRGVFVTIPNDMWHELNKSKDKEELLEQVGNLVVNAFSMSSIYRKITGGIRRNIKRKGKKKQTRADGVNYNAIIEVAKKLEAELKRKPSKYRLATEAGTTEHHALTALRMMEDNQI